MLKMLYIPQYQIASQDFMLYAKTNKHIHHTSMQICIIF